jgi:hypothetical protein
MNIEKNFIQLLVCVFELQMLLEKDTFDRNAFEKKLKQIECIKPGHI